MNIHLDNVNKNEQVTLVECRDWKCQEEEEEEEKEMRSFFP